MCNVLYISLVIIKYNYKYQINLISYPILIIPLVSRLNSMYYKPTISYVKYMLNSIVLNINILCNMKILHHYVFYDITIQIIKEIATYKNRKNLMKFYLALSRISFLECKNNKRKKQHSYCKM